MGLCKPATTHTISHTAIQEAVMRASQLVLVAALGAAVFLVVLSPDAAQAADSLNCGQISQDDMKSMLQGCSDGESCDSCAKKNMGKIVDKAGGKIDCKDMDDAKIKGQISSCLGAVSGKVLGAAKELDVDTNMDCNVDALMGEAKGKMCM